MLDLTCLKELEAIFAWLDAWVKPTENALIAVDAPTLIPNATGMRLPDRLSHKYFGRYHAGCYPANLSRPFASRLVQFGLSLEQRGFLHAPTIKPQHPGRYQIEVYPHPATVHLFGLQKILKYKKGKLAARQAQLNKLSQYMIEVLPNLQPRLEVKRQLLELNSPETVSKTKALKAREDRLDSLICAYVAAWWWYWGKERNWVLGDASTGYIVVPAPLKDQLGSDPMAQ